MKTFLLLVVAASLTLSKTRWRATGTNPKSRLVAAIAFAGALGTSDRSNTTQTQSKTEGQGCDIRGRASGMLRARGTRPDSGSALHSVGPFKQANSPADSRADGLPE
jgi:hypothetical protein